MEIKTNNRWDFHDDKEGRFCIVVTLEEMNGINRIDQVIRSWTTK